MRRLVHESGVVADVSELLEEAGVRHGFATRRGGISQGAFASLNLGNPASCATPDASETIEENYRRFTGTIGLSGHLRCAVHQVHGDRVARIDDPNQHNAAQQADALVSTHSRAALAIPVADCVPVLLADERGQVVAAAHAGWRGVIAGIVPKTISAMRELGAVRMVAAIGPCIGFDAFEVGSEVVEAFRSAFGGSAPIRLRADGKGHVDLREAVRRQLIDSGIDTGRIDVSEGCTFTNAEDFFSHRRDNGLTGRHAAMIARRSP